MNPGGHRQSSQPSFFPAFSNYASGLSFCVVNRSRSDRRPVVLGIRLDRFDHQIQFIGAIDLARNAVVGVWLHGVGFGEVMQAINAVSGMVEHHEDRTRAVFRPRVQGEVIGAAISLEQPILELVHCCLCSGVGGSRNHRDGSHNDAHKYDRRTNSEYLESAKPGNVKYPAHKHCEGYNQKNNPPLYALPHLANPFDQAG